jgi:prophage DNA circulation protein
MIAACEQAGPGTLVHPILGSLQVVLLDFTTTDRRDRGRYVEVELEFIDAATNAIMPAATTATAQVVANATNALNATSATSLAQNLGVLSPSPTAPTQFISNFANLATNAVNDPARALNAVSGLIGFYGRYAMGHMTTLQPETTTVAQALVNSVTTRQAVIAASNVLVAAGNAL